MTQAHIKTSPGQNSEKVLIRIFSKEAWWGWYDVGIFFFYQQQRLKKDEWSQGWHGMEVHFPTRQ